MKKTFKLLSFVWIVALLATSCYKNDIDILQSQIDQLKGGEIATLESQVAAINTTIGQLQTTQNQLQGYITTLQRDGETYKTQIAELKTADTKLGEKITELKAYTDNEIKNSKTWAEGTFATIDKMDSLCTVVAALESKVGEISSQLDSVKKQAIAGCTEAIKDAIAASETSMKAWVNEQLTGYYTMAQMDATLDSICRAHDKVDTTLLAEIAEQKSALDTAKAQITKAYKSAIQTACDSLNGVIDTKIANDISAAKTELQNQINTINTEIAGIKTRLSDAEQDIAALIDQIQSIEVIPTYDDGSVEITGTTSDTIRFDIRPERIADSLAKAWKAAEVAERAEMVSISLKGVKTKGLVADVTVDSVLYQGGEFKVAATFATPDTSAVAALHIAYGKSDVGSGYFKLYYYVKPALLPGKFTVNASGKQVQFSKGNLQATVDASGTPTAWNFASDQYGYIGNATANTSIGTGAGVVDLFGWSTSSTSYGISTSKTSSDYSGDFADWGKNPIANGGNTADQWSTLSSAEWTWILGPKSSPNPGTNCRTSSTINGTENARYAEVKVNGVCGLLIFPDTFTWPEGITTSKPGTFNTNPYAKDWNSVDYTAAEFILLESAGCVFLPAAGYRDGSSVGDVGSYGDYWSSTPSWSDGACDLYFSSGYAVQAGSYYFRFYGCSVRLVCAAQ